MPYPNFRRVNRAFAADKLTTTTTTTIIIVIIIIIIIIIIDNNGLRVELRKMRKRHSSMGP